MESNKKLEFLKVQEKTRNKNLQTMKNRPYTFNFLQIALFYLFLLSLLTKVKSQQASKFKQYKKPYISLIIMGTGKKKIIGTDSVIAPNAAFNTSSFTPLTIIESDGYKINLNTKTRETNITLEFSDTDIDMQYLFKDLDYIKKVDLSNFNDICWLLS